MNAGLLINGTDASLPLKEVSITAHVQGYLLGLDARLKYVNSSSQPVEVVFRTPVDAASAVVGLEAYIDGKRIRAEIKEKEEARQLYDDAITSGFTAALGEEKTKDIFSLMIGNLPPGKEADVCLTMVSELDIEADGSVRVVLPVVLKPRYSSPRHQGADPLQGPRPNTDYHVLHSSGPSVYKFQLVVADANSIAEVTSSSHAITTHINRAGNMEVELSNAIDSGTDDIVISIKPKKPHAVRVIVEQGDFNRDPTNEFIKSPALMVNFFPNLSTERFPVELVFLVDRSASMSGQFIADAMKTLLLFLKSIPEGCYFNIIGFGRDFRSLFPQSVLYNQQNLDVAVSHTQSMRADLGGTELLAPLLSICSQPLVNGLPRRVFVLTDGAVANTDEVIAYIKNNANKAR